VKNLRQAYFGNKTKTTPQRKMQKGQKGQNRRCRGVVLKRNPDGVGGRKESGEAQGKKLDQTGPGPDVLELPAKGVSSLMSPWSPGRPSSKADSIGTW